VSDSYPTLTDIFFENEGDIRIKLSLAESAQAFSALKKKLSEGRWTPFPHLMDLAAKNAKALLDIRIETILANAWGKYASLRKYLDKEKYPANTTVTAAVGEHTVKSEHHPYLEISMSGFERKISFDVAVELILDSIMLVIRDGRIRAIKTGEISAKGTLACEKVKIAEKKSKAVPLPGMIEFDEGIPIG
jgi:hypothetical protein